MVVEPDQIVKIIANQLRKRKIDEDKITSDASFMEVLGADSMDIVELIMALEEEFAIEIPENEAVKIRIVQDVIDYLNKVV